MQTSRTPRPAARRRSCGVDTVQALLGGALMLLAARAGVAQSLYDPTRPELRGGYMMSIALPFFKWSMFPERGTDNANIELVLPKFWRGRGWLDTLVPRLHLGATANLSGRTSYAYAGGLWTFNFSQRGFTELSLGGLVHNGQLDGDDPHQARLGCRELYEAGVNLGYHVSSRSTVMLSFDHGSNGRPVLSDCRYNEGLDLFGIRFGYAF
jgi:lipid A 3-O-deacylase